MSRLLRTSIPVFFALFFFSKSTAEPVKSSLDSLMDKAVALYLQGNTTAAIPLFDSCVGLATTTKNDKVLANAFNNLGNCYSQKGDAVTSLSYYQKSISIAERNGDKRRMAKTTQNIGSLYSEQGDLDRALQFHKQALALAEEIHDSSVIADCLNNEGIVFEQKKEYPKALEVYSKALSIYRILKDDSRLALGLNNLGIVYKYLKDYPKSISYYTESIFYSQKSGDQFTMAANLNNLGNVYSLMGNYKKALELFDQSLKIAMDIKAANVIYEVYGGMADAFLNLKQYQKAYDYRLKFEEEKNKYINEERSQQLNELQAKFETTKKEAQIKELKQQEEISYLTIFRQKSVIRNRNILISGIAFLLAGLFFVGYFYYGKQKLKNRIERETAIRDSEEKERIRIAKDIHDELGSGLSKIHFIAESVAKHQEESNTLGDLKVISENAKSLIDNMRDLIWALTPGQLNMDSLLSRVREYSYDYLEDFKIDLECSFPDKVPVLPLQKEAYRNIFMLVKEALNNIAKHSEATKVKIEITFNSSFLEVQIVDNGVGFNPSVTSSGNGLKNMAYRGNSINADVDIESRINQGTTIHLKLPLTNI